MKKLFSVLIVVAMLAALLVPFSVSAATNGALWAYANQVTESTAPVIDGELDDVWATTPEYVLSKHIPGSGESLDPGKKDTSRVSFRALYQEGVVYFLIEIEDDYLANNKNATHWKNDSLMFFISEDNNSTALGTNGKSYQSYAIVDHYDEPQKLLTRGTESQFSDSNESKYMVGFADGGETGEAYHAFIEIQLNPMTNAGCVTQDGHISLDFQYNDADSTDTANNNRTVVSKWVHTNGNKGQDNWGFLQFVASTKTIFGQGSEWRYVADPTDLPADWASSLDVSAEWATAAAPFGTEAPRVPGSVGAWADVKDTESYLYAVKEFTLTAEDIASLDGKALLTEIFYDESPVIYINGTKLHEESGYITNYETRKLADKATNVLKEGKNTIAVSLHQTAGGNEFDMSLFAVTGVTSKYTAQTTFETMALGEKNYDLYYQTRENASDATKTDFRIIVMADLEWLNSLTSMEAVITFSADGQDDVTLTATPSVVYKSLTAPNTVYVAEDGVVIFGWIITDVPADYAANAPTAVLNVQ